MFPLPVLQVRFPNPWSRRPLVRMQDAPGESGLWLETASWSCHMKTGTSENTSRAAMLHLNAVRAMGRWSAFEIAAPAFRIQQLKRGGSEKDIGRAPPDLAPAFAIRQAK